ncbi:T9SS type B sorting domain-containing protein [Hymenobacter glacialis]|uniref:T9SS type B sorting domain-containing protein n=1 Tax=Hymenobacter glacialis TaxID=1908236 RepID=UPI0013011FD1|nr:gliding motility-associated C-terminal domain-containing protein [Hymenobacter glacialis]
MLPSPFKGRIINGSDPNQYAINFVRLAGLELSPDGSRMYADTVNSSGVFQYDLLAGSPVAVAASRATIPVQIQNGQGFSDSGDLKLGPDGNIYVIRSSFSGVGRIEKANALAPFCRFVADGVRYGKGTAPARYTFPSTTNDLDLPPVVITGGGAIQGQAGCVGELLPFASTLSPFVTATAYAWDFGDPASGPLNQATGQAPTHRYQQAGTYTVRLVVTATSGQAFVTSQQVQVWPLPVVELGPDLTLCADEPRTLSVGPQPTGSTYRWHDGSTGAEFGARLTGTYRVTVTSPQGCVATDELNVELADCPSLPNIITPNGDAQNQTFVLKGLNAGDWALRIFNRWGREVFSQAAYDNSWAAQGQPDGVYYYLLTKATSGQKIKGWLEVRR